MSYILEALKKSDQQRQRGATPTLQAVQASVTAPKRPVLVHYGLLAAVLLVAGILIGWLRPWQPEQTSSETAIIAARSNSPAPQPAALLREIPANTMQKLPATNSTQTAAVRDVVQPMPDKPGRLASAAPEAMPFEDLPLQIQQELPAMTVQLHAYASQPGDRLVSINSIRLREGGYLMAGLRLEQITPEGMIFSYKGYRFRRGVR